MMLIGYLIHILDYMNDLPQKDRNAFNNVTDPNIIKAKKWVETIPKRSKNYESILNSGVFSKYIETPIMGLVKTLTTSENNKHPEMVWLVLPWLKKIWEKYNGEFYGEDFLRHQISKKIR